MTKTKATHTPGEIHAAYFAADTWELRTSAGIRVASEMNEMDAKHVARVHNCHDDLLAACEAMLPYCDTENDVRNDAEMNEGRTGGFGVASLKIRAAIAKANP